MDEKNQIIFQENYINGKKDKIIIEESLVEENSPKIYKAKEYNNYGELIFEGEYKNNERYKGDLYEYELFDKKKFSGSFKEGNKYYGKEYHLLCNIFSKTIFEGEFKEGQRYKGKEYNGFDELILEGEFKDGERYNGKGYNNISQFVYINGKIEGKVVTYDYENHELFEGEYKKGENIMEN